MTLVGGTEFQLLESNLANLIIHTDGPPLLSSRGPLGANSIRFFTNFLPSTLPRQGLLHSALRAGLQIEGVALYFLNDVFRLNLALEATECVVYGLAFLQPNFCQDNPLCPALHRQRLYVNPTLLSGCYRKWSLLYMRSVSIRLAQHPS